MSMNIGKEHAEYVNHVKRFIKETLTGDSKTDEETLQCLFEYLKSLFKRIKREQMIQGSRVVNIDKERVERWSAMNSIFRNHYAAVDEAGETTEREEAILMSSLSDLLGCGNNPQFNVKKRKELIRLDMQRRRQKRLIRLDMQRRRKRRRTTTTRTEEARVSEEKRDDDQQQG